MKIARHFSSLHYPGCHCGGVCFFVPYMRLDKNCDLPSNFVHFFVLDLIFICDLQGNAGRQCSVSVDNVVYESCVLLTD